MPRFKKSLDNKPLTLNDLPDVITPNQAAKVLAIGINSVYDFMHGGRIPYFKVGCHYKIVKRQLALAFGIIEGNSDGEVKHG